MIRSVILCICFVFTVISGGSALAGEGASIGMASTPLAERSADFDLQSRVKQAELLKIEAERSKLELEAKEIERRLNAKWWQQSTLAQYFVAMLITAALLFGWARTYLEPILRRESELNALTERRNETLNDLLEAENKKLIAEQTLLEEGREELRADRDRLSDDSKHLTKERDTLLTQQKLLKRVVSGLKIAVDQAAKEGSSFFSILNGGDPINKLQDAYGWNIWSDNCFGWLGYYLVIQHPDVIEGGRVFVGRVMEMEALKRDRPDSWRDDVARMNEQGPIIILDYTYFALLVDDKALVGGEVYKNGGGIVEFYAPLSDWAKELASLLCMNERVS